MRAVALLGPKANESHVRRFELPGVNVFTGNELDPTDQPDVVLIFGGDGTIHRHLGPVVEKQVPVLIVPLGSANDFAKSVGVETVHKALDAWQRFVATRKNVRAIDLGTIEPLPDKSSPQTHTASADPDRVQRQEPWAEESLDTLHFVPDGPRRDLPKLSPRIMQSQLRRAVESDREIGSLTYFGCIAGTGLDGAVNRRTLKQPAWLRAHGGYILALVQSLGRFRPPRITVSAEIDGHWRTLVDEPAMLVAAGNGPQYGNGMRLAHQAALDDGLLDLCFVRQLSKVRLLRLFHVVFRGGHIGMNEVEYRKASRLRLTSDPVTEVFADGEYVCPTPVEIGVRAAAMKLIV